MTRREAAIVSAYTGYLLGTFSAMHQYAEELMGGPVQSMMFGSVAFADALRNASKADFVALEVTDDSVSTAAC